MALLAGLAGVCMLDASASARDIRDAKRDDYVQSRPAGAPVMAVVSLSRQRVTVYDASGWIMRAPVSTGAAGYETPAGIYSILQKKAEHFSNLYDDAAMPFMQRLTWSGIALHAGVLPGYPASHGCVRMPSEFAERLFEATRLGMRVIVMRDDIGPADLSHPMLFKPASGERSTRTAEGPSAVALDAEPRPIPSFRALRMIAAAKTAEADAAASQLEATRRAAAAMYREAAAANKALRIAASAKLRAEAHLREIERRREAATDPTAVTELETVKTNALATLAEAQSRLDAVQTEVRPTQDAVVHMRQAAIAAQKAKADAEEAAREATRRMAPISVFISRQTQRLHVRQAREPLFESPVAIANPDTPMGTYVFTALEFANEETDLRWSAISMYGGVHASPPPSKGRHGVASGSEALRTDTRTAKSALERISIPEAALDRIQALISPGSALIISDEPLSRETGPATEFIVVMSGEPQGGIKIRSRQPEERTRYERLLRRGPYGLGPSFW
ncbi:MAG: L,D-transpeptidase family protein [Hyphomonadaceae bacterium]|nr:L,D-transpeptidase family protein [Hyphomonadaceae bacterium]